MPIAFLGHVILAITLFQLRIIVSINIVPLDIIRDFERWIFRSLGPPGFVFRHFILKTGYSYYRDENNKAIMNLS